MDRVDNDQNKEGECGGCGQLCLLPAPAIPTVILIAVRAANANFSRRRRRLRRGKGTQLSGRRRRTGVPRRRPWHRWRPPRNFTLLSISIPNLPYLAS